jgi:hypothetical protein
MIVRRRGVGHNKPNLIGRTRTRKLGASEPALGTAQVQPEPPPSPDDAGRFGRNQLTVRDKE